jgi:hypothetical protein
MKKSRLHPGVCLLIIVWFFIGISVLMSGGCATTETVRTVRQPAPEPYWDPPGNIKELPDEQPLESQRLPEESATKVVFTALADDITMLLGDNALVRWMYIELVKVCTAEIPPPPLDPPPD